MKCPFCDQTIPDEALFCGYCGNKVTGEEPAAEYPDSTTENVGQNFEAPEAPETAVSSADDVSEPEYDASETPEPEYDASETPEPERSADGASVNVLPEMPDNAQNFSTVNLGKNEQSEKSGSSIGGRAKDAFGKAAASVRNDTQQAAQAIKSRSFKELLRNKTVLICCAAVIVVILLIVIIACSAAGPSYKLKGAYYGVDDGVDSTFFYNGAIVKNVSLSDSASLLDSSLDGTAALVYDDGGLYIFKNGKSSLIDDDLDTKAASISANGKTVAYVSDDSVYVYTGGKPKKVADLESSYACYPVVSPNGKVVAFADYDDDDIKTYIWKGGSKAVDLDSGIIPVSVSDGGKMIYGANSSGKLCYIKNLKKGGEEKIGSIYKIAGISYDHTKILYTNDNGTYCFDTSLDKEDGVRISKSSVSPVSDFSYQDIPYIDNFKKFYGEASGNLYKFVRKGKEYDDVKLVSDFESGVFSEDYKSIVYIDDGDVMKGSLSNLKNADEIGDDAISVRANDTLSVIYYLEDDYTLRYTVKDKKIASDVRSYVVTDSGVCVFRDTDGDLYYSVKGGDKKKTGLDEVTSLVIRNNVIYVVSDDEVYTSTNGKSFNKTGVDVG